MKLSLSNKKYGLVKKKGQRTSNDSTAGVGGTSQKPALFSMDDDADEEEEDHRQKQENKDDRTRVNRYLQEQKQQDFATKRAREEALDLDSSIFDYDSWKGRADQERQAQEERRKQQDTKKPRYIQNLMKQAEKREREQEELRERKILREQEQEAANGDTEKFITSAYKKKLEERERMKEFERLEEEKEAREDVTKTQDFSGFYRNILASQVGGSGRDDHLASGDTIDPSRLPESQANALKEFQDSKRAHSHETSKDAESPSTTVSHAPAIAVHADEEIDLDDSKQRQSSKTTSEATQRVEVHKSTESTPHESGKELGDAELNVIQKITGSRYTGQLDKEERKTDSQSTAERKTQETEIEAAKRRALERRKKS